MVDSQTSTVLSTLTIYGIIGLALLVLFEFSRQQSVVYFPRCHSHKNRTPSPPSSGLISWIYSTLSISEKDTLRMIGMDAYVFLRVLRLFTLICFICGMLGLIVLIPIYATSPFNPENPGIRRWSMGNIPESDDRLWSSCIFTYVFSLIFLGLLHYEYSRFVQLRQQYFKGNHEQSSQSSYSILVESIPEKYRTHTKLKAFFEKLFPGSVHSAVLSLDVPDLHEKYTERCRVVKDLEVAVAKFEATGYSSTRADKTGKPSMFGCSAIDKIHYLKGELARLNEEIDKLQSALVEFDVSLDKQSDQGNSPSNSRLLSFKNVKRPISTNVAKAQLLSGEMSNSNGSVYPPGSSEALVVENDSQGNDDEIFLEEVKNSINIEITDYNVEFKTKLSSTGFVTFTSKQAQTAAYQLSVLDKDHPKFRALQAPQHNDIVWANVTISTNWLNISSYVTWVVLSAGIVFWAAIVSFIATISQLAFISKYLPFINDLDDVSYAVLAGVVPVAVLSIVLGILPVLFEAISTYFERRKTISEIHRMVFAWYFAYVLANVYLMLLSGSIASSLVTIIGEPTSIIRMLGTALPSVSIFFINFIIAQVLMGIPMQLLRIGPLIIWNLLFLCCTDQKKLTRRQLLEGPLADQTMNYGSTLPMVLYIVLIFQLYWIITPLIPVICCAYFAGLFLAYKYQYLYVYAANYESGGLFWFAIYSRVNTGLIISSLAMIGYMGIKNGAKQAIVLIPLPFIIYFIWKYTDSQFYKVSMNMSYSEAVAIDEDASVKSSIMKSFSDAFYRQKCITSPHGSPLPYREGDVPLLNERGQMNEVYYRTQDDISRGNSDEADLVEAAVGALLGGL